MTSDEPWHRAVTLRQLAIFDAVVRLQSVGEAGRELGLSQPAISHAVSRLERAVGSTLLDRGRYGSAPTEIGAILQRRVARLRDQIAAGLDSAQDGRGHADTIRLLSAALTSTQVAAHLAVAGHSSFRAAAQTLAISEPALQRSARELERLIGAALYQRRGQRIGVTTAGERLAAHLQLGQAEIEQAYDEIEAARGRSSGRITLGCLPLMPKAILATALGRLLLDHPHVEISLEEGPYDRLVAELRRGRLDMVLGALRTPGRDAAIEVRRLFEDPYVLVGRVGHPLGKRPSRSALSRQSWVAPPPGTPRRVALEALFDTFPRRPSIVLETASVTMMMAALAESDCLCLSARSQADTDFKQTDLKIFDTPIARETRDVGVTFRCDWLPTKVQAAFLDLLCTSDAGAVASG